MKDLGKSRASLARGNAAQRILNDPMVIAAFDALRDQLLNEWTQTDLDDTERREDCWRSLRLLNKIRQSFIQHVNTGRFAERELSKLRE